MNENIKVKSQYIVAIFLFIVSAILLLTFFYIVNKSTDIYTPIYSMNLTEEEKIEDFEYLYNVIIEEYRNLDEYSEVFSINFKEKKQYYIDKIKQTKTDYEFYCLIHTIINDIPSFHARVNFPVTDEYINGGFYNSNDIIKITNINGYTEYWLNILKNECSNLNINDTIWFKYVDGRYVLSYSENSVLIDKVFIETINGMSIDEYILNNTSCWKITYDSIKHKSYRPYLVFSTSPIGEAVDLGVTDISGELSNYKFYTSETLEASAWYCSYFNDQSIAEPRITTCVSGDIGYINIDSFGANAIEVAQGMQMISNSANIIIDIRDNPGGTIEFANNFVYKYISNTDIEQKTECRMLNTKTNKKFFNAFHEDKAGYGYSYTFSEDNKDLIIMDTTKYNGGNIINPPKLYLLVSSKTGSAADNFTNVIKSNNIGVVVGTNTGGEGLTGTYAMECLPNSRILFTYTPCQANNNDGTDNSVYGTSPDIYSELSIENYIIQQELIDNGEDPYTYENRLKWDNVLIETLELIKEDENDKGNNTADE